jgi:ATP-dependent Lon protease
MLGEIIRAMRKVKCMEIVRIANPVEDEKVGIARRCLIPHPIAKHGLNEGG